MQKGTVSKKCWNAANAAVENTKNRWLFVGCKRERSLKIVGTQSMELERTKGIGACLRDAKGNDLSKVLEHSQ